MAQYEPHLLLPTSDTQQMRSHSLRRGRAASDSTVYIKIIVAVRTKGEVEWRLEGDRRVGEIRKSLPQQIRRERTDRPLLLWLWPPWPPPTGRRMNAAGEDEAKQHLVIIRVSPLNVNPAEIVSDDRRSD